MSASLVNVGTANQTSTLTFYLVYFT